MAADPSVEPGGRLARSALVTAASIVATMGIGALLAVLVLVRFGKDAETDGFFAAYGVYGVLLTFAQSLRASVVARLVEDPSPFASLDRFLRAGLLVTACAAVPLVFLGGPLAGALTGDLGADARDTAREALALLWVAAGAHVIAALGAAALGARGDFAYPGLAYVAGGALAIGLLLALADSIGITAVAVGLAAGALFTSGCMLWRLAQAGYRPSFAMFERARGQTVRAAAMMVAGSGGMLTIQLMYTISLAFAARLEEGAVTLYTYAFFAAAVPAGAMSSTAAFVLAAPLSRTWDRRPRTLEPHLIAVYRVGAVLAVLLLALAALIGKDVLDLVVGGSLDSGDASTIVTTFLALAGVLLASTALPVPLLAAFATARYWAVAAVAGVALVAHAGASALAEGADTLEALGVAASFSAILFLVLICALTWKSELPRVLALLMRELAPPLVIALVTFGPPALVAIALPGPATRALAAAAGSFAFLMALRVRLPEHHELLMRLVRPRSGGGAPAL
jgi:peptidoglycan biosynthesis protein MviN/MurJ (putative lipid II flippase)